MIKIMGFIFLFSISSLGQEKLGIKILDKQIHKFSLLQTYTNKLFGSIDKSAHLNKKGKKFLKSKLLDFQQQELDAQRITIQMLLKQHSKLNEDQRKQLSRFYKSSEISELMKLRGHPKFDLRFESFLIKVNLKKYSQKKIDAISEYTKYSNTHSSNLNSELVKLKNLYLLKGLSVKKIKRLSAYLKDPQLSKIVAISEQGSSFSDKNYSEVNSRFKRIQSKSVKRQLASN